MEKTEVKTVNVKLLKPHEHAGMEYSVGMEITVPEHDADWLKKLNIAEDVKATTATPITKTAEDK